MAATGNGFAVARAMADSEVLQAYDAQIATKDTLISALEMTKPGLVRDSFKSMGLNFNDKFVTGFLFGDAILFGVITWPIPSN